MKNYSSGRAVIAGDAVSIPNLHSRKNVLLNILTRHTDCHLIKALALAPQLRYATVISSTISAVDPGRPLAGRIHTSHPPLRQSMHERHHPKNHANLRRHPLCPREPRAGTGNRMRSKAGPHLPWTRARQSRRRGCRQGGSGWVGESAERGMGVGLERHGGG
jgi:hypothetical protein